MRFITFFTNNGDIYGLPLILVAENRAKEIVNMDSDATFKEEVDFVMEDDYEGTDWFQNNCDPEDFPEECYVLLERGKTESLYDKIRGSSIISFADREV